MLAVTNPAPAQPSVGEQFVSLASQGYAGYLQARAQRKLMDINLQRLQRGERPISQDDLVNLIPPARVQVEPGPKISAQLRGLVVPAAVVGGLLFLAARRK